MFRTPSVIATNWSGVTEFLDESVGYPLPIDGLVHAQGWASGLKWAQPSVAQLRCAAGVRMRAGRRRRSPRCRQRRALCVATPAPALTIALPSLQTVPLHHPPPPGSSCAPP
jgi:hypothetical protein